METNWAEEHLQTIRTLMERTAVYRRALAPIMTYLGVVGITAAVLGLALKISAPREFIIFWAAVAPFAVVGSLLLVRRQALKDAEPFWSPPTRRIMQAMLPPLAAGCIAGAVIFTMADLSIDPMGYVASMFWLPLIWVVLYGCAFHAAGFFMPRGMKLFGWLFVLGGCGLFLSDLPDQLKPVQYAHGIMGVFFGVLHLAYGIYLYFTEQRKNAS